MNSKSDSGLPDKAIQQLKSVFLNYPEIDAVWLYGSRALGTYRHGSDIDLCIESPNLQLSQLLAIETQIDDLLLPWKIDLSIKRDIDNIELLKHIEKCGKQLFP